MQIYQNFPNTSSNGPMARTSTSETCPRGSKNKAKGDTNIDCKINADTEKWMGQIAVKIPGQFSAQINRLKGESDGAIY